MDSRGYQKYLDSVRGYQSVRPHRAVPSCPPTPPHPPPGCPTGPTGGTGPDGLIGPIGHTGEDGETGPVGMNGTAGGIVLFMNIDEVVMVNGIKFYNIDSQLNESCAPTIKSVVVSDSSLGTAAPYVIIPGGDIVSGSEVQFALIDGLLSSNIVPPGMWDMHIWVRTAQPDVVSLQWTLYFQDDHGSFTPNPFAASERVTITNASLTTATELVIPLYVEKPICLCETSTRILLGIRAYSTTPNAGLSLYFESCSASFIRTTLVPLGATGLAGTTGPTGMTGDIGPQGVPGSATNTGATGEVGPTGITGEVGPQGVPGTATNTGATGQTGQKG